MELPFPLRENHRRDTKYSWKKLGLVWENEGEFDAIYKRYIYARECELCNKTFTKSRDRHMEHDHDIGKIRNIVCCRCNLRKADRKNSNNTSGYKGIYWVEGNKRWQFIAHIGGKNTYIKGSKDKDKLIEFTEKWKVENNYHT